MNELIKLQPQTINGNAVETVNARELHTFLESKQDFSTWIKNRIEKYEFVENADYLLHKFMEQTPSGAKHKTDYYVSVGMAKELAMVENNDKGKHALMIGLRTVLVNMISLKIKTLFASTKKWKPIMPP